MNKIRLLRILDNKTIVRLQDIERITGFGGKYAKRLNEKKNIWISELKPLTRNVLKFEDAKKAILKSLE
jgi:hypothetical protein